MCRLLMRRLGARRHGCIAFRPWAGGAIADRKNIVVAGGLQRLSDNELVGLVGFKAVEDVKKRGCLDAGRPDYELGSDNAAICEFDAIWHDGGDPRRGVDFHAKSGEEIGRGFGDPLRQSRQNPIGGFDKVQRDVSVGIDAVESEGHELSRRFVQLGGELDAGGAGANDRDLKLTWPQRLILALGPQARIDEAAVESRGLVGRLQANCVLRNPRRAEIIGETADRQYERVVTITAGRRYFGAILLDNRAD